MNTGTRILEALSIAFLTIAWFAVCFGPMLWMEYGQ